MGRHLVWSLLPLVLATAAWSMGSRGAEPAPERAEYTSLQLIAAAEDSGVIDADTAVEYRVYAVKAGGRLPESYRGGRPMKDAMGVLRQARASFSELRPEVQERLKPYLYPKGR